MNDDLFPPDGKPPDTSTALLRELATGADAARWTQFVELYGPVLRCWLKGLKARDLPWLEPAMFDDIVQETFVSLVKVFPNGGYRRDRARFRTFLHAILRKRAVDFLRKSGNHALRFLPDDRSQDALDASPDAFSLPLGGGDTPGLRELRSRLCSLMVERVFRESNFSGQSRAVFFRLMAGESTDALAREYGLERNAIYQLKSRVMKALAAKARTLSRGAGDLLDLVFALEGEQGGSSHD
jgi:RNA polymerase sigma factor (sigma-70 family)